MPRNRRRIRSRPPSTAMTAIAHFGNVSPPLSPAPPCRLPSVGDAIRLEEEDKEAAEADRAEAELADAAELAEAADLADAEDIEASTDEGGDVWIALNVL